MASNSTSIRPASEPPAPAATGASLCFNFAGILGASLATYVATWLATRHGLAYVGYYLSGAALLSLGALGLVRRPRSRPARGRSLVRRAVLG
jgi:hypothetical protein